MIMKQILIPTLTTCLVVFATTTQANPNHGLPVVPLIAKPGCLEKCGSVSIPFPFGISFGCFSNKWFEIVCKNRPFLKLIPELEILSISTEESVIYTQNPISFFNCPNKTSSRALNLTGSPFSFSESRNRLTVVGCDLFAYIDVSSDDVSIRAAGCSPTCSNLGNNSVAGNNSLVASPRLDRNYCQTILPSYVTSYEIDVDYDARVNDSTVISEETCRYAFVVDEKWFKSRSNSIKNFTAVIREMDNVQVILSWDFMQDCEMTKDMRQSNKFNCEKTDAASYINGTKISCRCHEGYRGNPYLFSDGCQDLNECEDDPKICNDVRLICENTIGNYRCKYKRIHKLRSALIGIGGGVGALVLLFGSWGLHKLFKRREDAKRRNKFFKRNGGLLLHQRRTNSSNDHENQTNLFNAKELERATDHFNVNRVLGQGGQGTVYKGMLGDGRIVAVKKSKLGNRNMVAEFINEVVILSQINHRNVVKLLGCCLETEVPLLVYEFVPNGTLHHYIHDQSEEFKLTWEIRLRIAVEVAGALSYLHSSASVPIYHRDIKSANILLDEKFRAKVADFGTSKSVPEDKTHVTTHVSGTFGYVDPEYFRSSQFTEKSDVYSFGVVVVELLTGQKPVSQTSSNRGRSLAMHFVDCVENNTVFGIIDPRIAKEACNNKLAITSVASLAYRCLDLAGKNRPTMKEVATELEGIQKLLVNIYSDHENDHVTLEKSGAIHACMRLEMSERNWESTDTSIAGSGLDASTVLSSFNASM